jgi:hypothetical protein
VSKSSATGFSLVLGWSLAAMGAAGCGGSSADPGGGTPAPPTPFDLPLAMSSGGPILAAPRVQPIFFPGFAFAAEVDGFLAALQASSYWPGVAAEYGIGALAVAAGHVSSVAAPGSLTSTDIEGLLAQVVAADNEQLGAPSSDTIYPLFFPATTTIISDGVAMCGDGAASGFHAEWTVNGTRLAGVVIPSCASFPGAPTLSGFSALTPTISHELVEAATDPFPTSAPAFVNTDDEHAMWSVALNGGEIADLCENESPNLVVPSDIGLPVQRVWSNAAVKAGTGPCVPVPPGEIFFVAVPALPSRVSVERDGQAFTVPALSAPVGSDATVSVDFRSEAGAQMAWTVGALEYHADSTIVPQGSSASGTPGQTVRIDVVPNEVKTGVFPLIVASVTRGARHFWIGTVKRQ